MSIGLRIEATIELNKFCVTIFCRFIFDGHISCEAMNCYCFLGCWGDLAEVDLEFWFCQFKNDLGWSSMANSGTSSEHFWGENTCNNRRDASLMNEHWRRFSDKLCMAMVWSRSRGNFRWTACTASGSWRICKDLQSMFYEVNLDVNRWKGVFCKNRFQGSYAVSFLRDDYLQGKVFALLCQEPSLNCGRGVQVFSELLPLLQEVCKFHGPWAWKPSKESI